MIASAPTRASSASDRSAALSAKGTRLNRRGLATRQRILDVAVGLLSTGGAEVVSANLIAREAGVTWGTIQHQFGDADGVWASVIEHISTGPALHPATSRLASLPLAMRIEAIVDLVWNSLDTPSGRAVHTLRMFLPRDRAALRRDYPRTAAAFAAWDSRWAQVWNQAFDGLSVPRDRLDKTRSFMPGAIRGLHLLSGMSSFSDDDAARACLIEALTVYLS
jgi:AcrR family transcriptional regulator